MSPTPDGRRQQDAHDATREIKTFKDRDHFCRVVLGTTELSQTDRNIIVRLAFHQNIEERKCSAKYETLAREVGVSSRTAMRAVAAGAARGLLTIQHGGGRGKANNFVLLIPVETVTQACHPLAAERVTEKGDNRRPKRVTPRCHSLSEESNPKGSARADPLGEREIESLTRFDDQPDFWSGAYAPPKSVEGEKRQDRGPPATPSRAVEIIPPAEVLTFDRERIWREVCSTYSVRPWPDDMRAAKQSFNRLCDEGAAPLDIVEGIRRWVAFYVDGDGAQFLPKLRDLLDSGKWAIEPPKRGKKPPHPNQQTRRNGSKPDLSKMFLAEAGYVEDDDGNMAWGGAS